MLEWNNIHNKFWVNLLMLIMCSQLKTLPEYMQWVCNLLLSSMSSENINKKLMTKKHQPSADLAKYIFSWNVIIIKKSLITLFRCSNFFYSSLVCKLVFTFFLKQLLHCGDYLSLMTISYDITSFNDFIHITINKSTNRCNLV